MKRILIILVVWILTLTGLSGCMSTTTHSDPEKPMSSEQAAETATAAGNSSMPTPQQSIAPTDSAVPLVTTIKTDTYTYSSQYINVSLEMPTISGLEDRTVLDKINKVISDVGEAAKKTIADMESESKQIQDDGYGSGTPFELGIGYQVDYNKNGLLSLTLSNYQYTGGAHGGELRSSYIFDLATGNRLMLTDLMKKDSNYRAYINSSIRNEIDKLAEKGEIYELTRFEDIGDTPDFYLSENAIVFYFQQYAYFPYAAGIQEFPISYKELDGMLRSDIKL